MRKKFVLISILLAVFCLSGCTFDNNNTQKGGRQDYPFRRWEKGFSMLFSDDMKEKYPDIEILEKKEEQKMAENIGKGMPLKPNYLFEIKRNIKGLLGVYKTDTNKLIIPHEYRYLEQCNHNYFMFFKARNYDNTKILDYRNNVLFESNYDETDCATCFGGIKTKNNNKYGMVSYSGIEVLKPQFDQITSQKHWGESGGFYYIARKGNLYGVWDNKGREIIPLQKKKLSKSDKGHHFFEYEYKGKTGIMDIYGNLLTYAQYDDIMHRQTTGKNDSSPKAENNVVTDLSRNNIYKKYGKENVHQIAMDYYAIGQPQRGMYIVNKYGKRTSKKSYPSIYRLTEKYAIFITFGENGGTYGVIDFNGNVIMETKKSISYIRNATDNGLILFDKGDKKGIFYENKMITPPEFERIYFTRGHVLIRFYKDDKKYYYIASYEDFAKNKGDLSKCAQYRTNTYKKLDDNCFKVTDEDGNEKVYCGK